MQCKDLMKKNIIHIKSNSTILEAAKMMSENNIGFLPVIKDSSLVGVITDRDIIKRVIANNKDTKEFIANYITTSIIYSFDDDDISVAITKMADYQIKRMIILDHKFNLVGIITLKDLALNNHTNKYINDLLKEISLPLIHPIKYQFTSNSEV